MKFEYTPTAVRETAEGLRFRVRRLNISDRTRRDVSHMIDRTYDYASPRELRWHLADVFRMDPKSVDVRAA